MPYDPILTTDAPFVFATTIIRTPELTSLRYGDMVMAVDWPTQKQELEREVPIAIRRTAAANAPITAQISHFVVREGDKVVMVAPDGTKSPVQFEGHEASYTIARDDLMKRGADVLTDAVTAIGGSLGRGMDENLAALLRKATPRSGGTFAADDKEAFFAQFLEVLRQMDMTFDEDGKPSTFGVMSPEGFTLLKEIEDDPTYTERFNALLEKKRDEYFRRESYRKLVD